MTRSAIVIAFTLVLAGCTPPNSRVVTRANELAGLHGDIPSASNPLRWKVITSGVNSTNSTMYTLYGNDAAVQYARTRTDRNYPSGAVLALVIWQRQEDVRWFGAEIPARPNSVEFLDVTPSAEGRSMQVYRRYEGMPLKEVKPPFTQADPRIEHLLSLRAAVMP